jgi:predicted alpha/beta-fold hydrolase
MSATPSPLSSDRSRDFADQRDLFLPPLIMRNGHVQTLAGTYLFGRWTGHRVLIPITSTTGEITLSDGDRLVYHDDCPADWQPGDRVALLLHGLAGSHLSPYMTRIAGKLNKQKVRTFRLNWRGCGTGMAVARYPYHSGRSEDVLAMIAELQTRCPNSAINLIGFSMGGNIALKLLGEAGAVSSGTAGIARAVAVCPPIDLLTTVESLRSGLASWYDAYFAKECIRNVRQRQQANPNAIIPEGWFSQLPRTMREFDETFTAPICGFASSAAYYARCSANQFLPTIAVPTLVIAAQDDPVVPYDPFLAAVLSPAIKLKAPRHGGHMGFVSASGPSWLDQQIIDWTLGCE